jgi:hypothetical protein
MMIGLSFQQNMDFLPKYTIIEPYDWWANDSEGTHTHARSWLMAGWKTVEVKPGNKVTYIK